MREQLSKDNPVAYSLTGILYAAFNSWDHKAVSQSFPHSVSECNCKTAVTWADCLLYERVVFPVWFLKRRTSPIISVSPTPSPAPGLAISQPHTNSCVPLPDCLCSSQCVHSFSATSLVLVSVVFWLSFVIWFLDFCLLPARPVCVCQSDLLCMIAWFTSGDFHFWTPACVLFLSLC